jgi:hypothetical protein
MDIGADGGGPGHNPVAYVPCDGHDQFNPRIGAQDMREVGNSFPPPPHGMQIAIDGSRLAEDLGGG